MPSRAVLVLSAVLLVLVAAPASSAPTKAIAPAFDSAEADPGICYETIPHPLGTCTTQATADAATGKATMALRSMNGKATDAHDRFRTSYAHHSPVASLTFEAVIDVARASISGGGSGYLETSIYVSDTGCGSACSIAMEGFRTTIVSTDPGSPSSVQGARSIVRVSLSDPSGRLAPGTTTVLIDLNGSTLESVASPAELVMDATVSSVRVSVSR